MSNNMGDDDSSYPDPNRLVATPYPVLFDGPSQNTPYPSISRKGKAPERLATEDTDLSGDELNEDARAIAQEFYNEAGPPRGFDETDGETDFERIIYESDAVGDIVDAIAGPEQTNGRRSKANAGTKRKRGWRQLLKGTGFENLGRGERGPAPPRKKPGPQKRKERGVDPGPEFKAALARASQDFMAGKYDSAADYARDAIKVNPEIFAAHSLLSEILKIQGKNDDSLRALTYGAYVSRSPKVWLNILERMLDQIEVEPSETLIREALDCVKEALRLKTALNDELEYVLRCHRFELYKQLGDQAAARHACKHIVKRWPGDIEMCREFAELCVSWQDQFELRLAKEYYDAALELKTDQPISDVSENAWRHVIAYAELVHAIQGSAQAIAACKRLARWVLERKHETFWESWSSDDREFDTTNERRSHVAETQQGSASLDPMKYGQGLPIEVRVKLGLYRIDLGQSHYDEAVRHFEALLEYENSIEYYYDLYLKAAKALNGAGIRAEALRYYDILRDVPDVIDESTWMEMGTCYESLDRDEDAAECFEEIMAFKGTLYCWASARLAKRAAEQGDVDKARLLCEQVIQIGRKDLLDAAQLRNVMSLSPSPGADSPPTRTGDSTERRAPKASTVRKPPDMNAPGPLTSVLVPEFGPPRGRDYAGIFSEFQLDGLPIAEPKETTTAKRSRKRKARADRGSDTETPRRAKQPKPSTRRTTTSGEERLRQIQDASSRVQSNFSVVRMHWSALKTGEDEVAVQLWKESALLLLDDFMATRVFFAERDKHIPLKVSKHEASLFVRVSSKEENAEAPTEFHGIPLEEWHRLFGDLALLYAETAQQERCYSVVQDTLMAANVFWQNPELEMITFAVAMCCAMKFNDGQFLIDITRKIISKSDRSAVAYQLFAAVNRFTYNNNWFNAGPSQKFMLRMVKSADFLAMTEEMRERYDFAMNKSSLQQRLAKLEGEAQHPNPGAIMLYGHMVAVANHSFSALPYYFRVLAMFPNDVCVNLSIATMWVQNSMKRQTENRHFGLTQGLAFLYRYYELRTASGRACDLQEAEYNVARMWHYLGLTHLAMPAYEKVLSLSAQVQAERWPGDEMAALEDDEDVEDYAYEAAFALQGIYATTGNDEAAQKITERWLVI